MKQSLSRVFAILAVLPFLLGPFLLGPVLLGPVLLGPVLLGGSPPAHSAERTVTLSVDMWCPSCPYIIKRTLARVPGVLDVNVSFDDQVAVVRFDDGRTSVTALTQATADVGFPSEPLTAN